MSQALTRGDKGFFAFAMVFSLIAVGIIAWILVGPRETPAAAGLDVSFLPAVNASLNATAAALLAFGWIAIRQKQQDRHKKLMLGAFAASSLFLISYLTYHYVHGDTSYPREGSGLDRAFYLLVLASHVILSIPVVPMALMAFYFAFRRDFVRHRRITRILAPIWLYVSVTGVLVFLLLRAKLAYG